MISIWVKSRRGLGICAALFIANISIDVVSAIPVEVSNPVNDFLRRLEEKGIIESGFTSTLPLDEITVAAALKRAQEKDSLLSKWDMIRLNRYLAEFDPEEKLRGTVLHYEDSVFKLQGGVGYYTGGNWQDSLPKPNGYLFGSLTPGVEATYGKNLDLVSSATVGMERDIAPRFVENYDPQRGLPYNTNREGKEGIPQTVSTLDGFRDVLGFGNSYLRVEAGQDWNQWGPGHWQHTTLGAHPFFWVADSLAPSNGVGFQGSDSLVPGGYRRGYRYPGEGPPLPQIRMHAGFGNWEYVKIIAQRTGLWYDSAAYLIAHRLQVRFGNFLRLGATEMMAMGRSPDWIDLLPAIPLKFAEHEGGNGDNIAISADAEWLWIGHGRFYGEFYVDDFSGPPLNYWGNKFAYVLGSSWQDPFGLPSEVHIEYAETDPWVYEHDLYNTQMQSSGALLGSILPPNAQAVFSSVAFPISTNIQGEIGWQWRQRDLESPGSSIFDIHVPADGNTKAFLAENVENRNQGTFSLEWQWSRFVLLKAGMGGLWVENWHGIPSENLTTPTASGEVHLQY